MSAKLSKKKVGRVSQTGNLFIFIVFSLFGDTGNSSSLYEQPIINPSKKVMNTYYLVGLFVILFFYCIYLVVEAAGRFGSTEQRNVPCSFASKNWFTNQVCLWRIRENERNK